VKTLTPLREKRVARKGAKKNRKGRRGKNLLEFAKFKNQGSDKPF
jgi:hypothetical protein